MKQKLLIKGILFLFLTLCISHAQAQTFTKININATGNSNPEFVHDLGNGSVAFMANDGTSSGRQVWKSDGTHGGTRKLQAPAIFANGLVQAPTIRQMAVMDGEFYFVTGTAASANATLFRTKGNALEVLATRTGNVSSAYNYLTVMGNTLYFSQPNGLYKIDKNLNAPVLIKDEISDIVNLNVFNNKLVFRATTADYGNELWISDGTETGTDMLKDINPDMANSFAATNFLFVTKDYFFFLAVDGTAPGNANNSDWWVSDGTELGTKRITNYAATAATAAYLAHSLPAHYLIDKNNNTIYVSHSQTAGLWVLNHSSAEVTGPTISTTAAARYYRGMESVMGNNYFMYNENGVSNWSLYKINGTATELLKKDIVNGNSSSFGILIPELNGKVYLSIGGKLWKTDGTAIGTVEHNGELSAVGVVSYVEPNRSGYYQIGVDGKLYFLSTLTTAEATYAKLISTDGTTAVQIEVNGTSTANIKRMYSSGNKLFLTVRTATSPATIMDLFVADITPQTQPVTFGNFNVRAEGKRAKLEWNTSQESNNKEFIIYRKGDPSTGSGQEDFIQVGIKAGAGTTAIPQNYVWYDNAPLNGINYYKLVQVDNDGKSTELAINPLHFSLSAEGLQVYPNPVTNGILSLALPMAKTGAEVSIVGLDGKAVAVVAVGSTRLSINVGHLVPGTYTVVYKKGTEVLTAKFIKQ